MRLGGVVSSHLWDTTKNIPVIVEMNETFILVLVASSAAAKIHD